MQDNMSEVSASPAQGGELSLDDISQADDSFKDLDELRSIGDRTQMIVEDWGDDFLTPDADQHNKSDAASSDFDQELDRIYGNSDGNAEDGDRDDDNAFAVQASDDIQQIQSDDIEARDGDFDANDAAPDAVIDFNVDGTKDDYDTELVPESGPVEDFEGYLDTAPVDDAIIDPATADEAIESEPVELPDVDAGVEQPELVDDQGDEGEVDIGDGFEQNFAEPEEPMIDEQQDAFGYDEPAVELTEATAEAAIEEAVEPEEREDEEIPPPPPSSPPLDDEFLEPDDATTVTDGTRTSKASSMNREMFDDLIYRAGNDRDGLPVVVFLPCDIRKVVGESFIPGSKANLAKEEEKIFSYCVDFLGQVASKGPFVLIVAAAGESTHLFPTRDSLAKLKELHALMPRMPHKKNMKKLIVLHPDPFTSAGLWLLSQTVSLKFWRKLVFVKRVADLDCLLEPSSNGEQVSLPLPENVLFFDITDAVGMDSTSRTGRNSTAGRQARVRAESEAPSPPSSFANYSAVASSFGVPLSVLAARSPFGIPSIVIRCVTYLCRHGVRTPGLFRVPGNADNVADAKRKLDAGMDIDLGGYWSKSGRPATVEDVHVCASLLKTFVRELPKPILTHAAYSSIMGESETQGDQDKLALAIREVCELLPKAHRVLLQYLSYFMQFVLQNEKDNHMTATNLAIVWVPNLFRDEADPDDPSKELRNLPHAMRAALVMFTHAAVVFPLEKYTILPICYDIDTGLSMPVEMICTHDVTHLSMSKKPIPIDHREFDAKMSRRMLPKASFSLRTILTPVSKSDANSSERNRSGSKEEEEDVLKMMEKGNALSDVPDPSTVAELSSLSVKDLKRYLIKNGYDPTSCLEKSDLRRMAIECFKAKHGSQAAAQAEEVMIARPPNGMRRSFSFEMQRKRKSSEMYSEDSGGSKRGSDLGNSLRDRKDSDVAFLSVLKNAGLAVDDVIEQFQNFANEETASLDSSSKTVHSAPATSKRDFNQVQLTSGNSAPPKSTGLMGAFLRRKSLLTRENKRDLAKSARGIKQTASGKATGSAIASFPSTPEQSPTEIKRKLSMKRTSSSDQQPASMEETVRALKETPLFGDDRERSASNGRPLSHSSSSNSSTTQQGAKSSGDNKPSPLQLPSAKAASKWKLKDVDMMTIKDLKALLVAHGKDAVDCKTIEDLREKARRTLLNAVVDPFYFSRTIDKSRSLRLSDSLVLCWTRARLM